MKSNQAIELQRWMNPGRGEKETCQRKAGRRETAAEKKSGVAGPKGETRENGGKK